MSVILTCSLVAGGIFLGRVIARTLQRRGENARDKNGVNGNNGQSGGDTGGDSSGDSKKNGDTRTDAKHDAKVDVKKSPPKPAAKPDDGADLLESFPCHLGDVVMRVTGEEAWLAGCVIFSEDAPVSALFVAPEAGADLAIFARPAPSRQIAWLSPSDPKDILVAGEPPTSVEVAGTRYDRVRRLPLRARRVGTGTPDVGDQVIVAEYAGAGAERLIVVMGQGSARAWRGESLEDGTYEVLASGRSTLE